MTTFDQIAPTRPRLQRDVLFTETPQGVLFHAEASRRGTRRRSAGDHRAPRSHGMPRGAPALRAK